MAKQGDGKRGDDDRVFVKDGFRSFRRTYRKEEAYWGAGTAAVLLGVVGWVTWKGKHPDPSLFDMSAALEGEPVTNATAPEAEGRRRVERLGPPRAGLSAGEPASSSENGPERGPLPEGLAEGGYRPGKVARYSSDTLYVKINGRAGFFQSFGVQSLHTVTLDGPGSEAAPASVDIELYDLGQARNAIGAYNGERPPGVEATAAEGSTFHLDRNAGFLARGRYYARFIGSDESPAVVAEVRRLLELFRRELPGEALPWGFALFVDQLKLPASAVTYVKSNAFSFGFARDVFKASLSPASAEEDMEAFVVALADPAAAENMAAQYRDGFDSLGKPAGQVNGVSWFEDEFLATFSGARAVERWVIGVRGAPTAERAAQELERLRQGLEALPEAERARAVPSPAEEEPTGEYGGAAAPAAESTPGAPADSPPLPTSAEEGSDEY